ncbi:hypothetical protein LCGC14_1510020 [marine sediment metagenome]|uniref:Uncharacterized protein n=1 Tax=marine sediment metagenome TaxID=412755 RepID=A0A0F9J1X2_9ZZZZ
MDDPTDYVVTVPMTFTHPCAPGRRGLDAWIAEGDAAGDPETGKDWWFTTYGVLPVFQGGCRLYIVCEGRLRGYAPITNIMFDESRMHDGKGPIAFVRRGGGVAVTIDQTVRGFRGYRRRWWERSDEVAFPGWKTADRRKY